MLGDASKYAGSLVLPQSHASMHDDKSKAIWHPITYDSRLFQESQFSWAALNQRLLQYT